MFVKLKNNQAFLKAVIFGDTGSGKTTLAERMAIGLADKNKKVFILDSEGGAEFFASHLEEHSIECFTYDKEFTSFNIFVNALKMAVDERPDVIILDSITHFGELCTQEFVDGVDEKRKFSAWGIAKKQWNEKVASVLKKAQCHVIVCGRETSGMAMERKNGKLDVSYSNPTKTRSGFDIDYELNLLIRMESRLDDKAKQYRVACVLKDRSNKIDGAEFINPDYKNIAPHLDGLHIMTEAEKKEREVAFNDLKEKLLHANSLQDLEAVKKEIQNTREKLAKDQLEELRKVYANKKESFIEQPTEQGEDIEDEERKAIQEVN